MAPGPSASPSERYFWGVDCGSAEIKVVVCDDGGRILDRRRKRTLFPLIEHVRAALDGGTADPFSTPFGPDGATVKPGHRVTVTGYGRNHLGFADGRLTEIKAHFLGVRKQLGGAESSGPYTIVDIGGQDSKVITVREDDVQRFVINRKCAAGTGAFIEELAHRLEIGLDQLDGLSRRHDKELALSSYCTVFAGQEVIRILMHGEKVENLIHAMYESVAKRVLEMTAIATDTVVFSGGVMSHHPAMMEIFQGKLKGKRLVVASDAQFCGAIGAALYGMEGRDEAD